MITLEQRQEIIRLLEKGEELSPEWARILFPPEKREYELVYHGKEREEDIIANTLAVPLQPVRTFGTNGSKVNGEWHNMLIFGDNLQIMKSLLDMKKAGKLCNADGTPGVRLVYIDPPFATKQEFRGSQDQKAYQDKIAGARFLEFLRKRLVFLREMLSDDGSIYVHLDYKKSHYVKTLLDEIFGEQNFRNEIIVKRVTKNLQRQFDTIENLPQGHDVLYWYTKQTSTRFRLLLTARKEFNEEGYWKDFWSNADRPTMRYSLLGVTPTSGQWKWSEERAEKAVNNYKQYLRESKGKSLLEYWQENDEVMEFIRKSPTGKIEHWISPDEMKF
ncbi:MAG: DNA methyltransferase [Candidatus Brocadiaceae bacterium]|nr:DNA methyltransferase [Candidatus Brocadiaceae bacterium]